MSDRAKTLIINWCVAVTLAVGVFLLRFLLQGDYSTRGWSDALTLSGFIELAPMLLYLIGRTGVFDTLSYSFYRLGESFKAQETKRFETAYDYRQYQRQKRMEHRPYVLPYLIMGGVCLLLAIVLVFVWHSTNNVSGSSAFSAISVVKALTK